MIGRLLRLAFLAAALWLYAGLALVGGVNVVFSVLAVIVATILLRELWRLLLKAGG